MFYIIWEFIRFLIITGFLMLSCAAFARAQTTAFTYQGKLTENALAANGSYQMQFALYDAAAGGNQIGGSVLVSAVQVTNGIFTVSLDFGANAFPGASRYLEISVYSGATNSFVALSPRQPFTSAPYAIKSQASTTAESAENSNNLGGIPANQYVQTNDPRLSDDRNPLPGSGNYIQNTDVTQTANFNISGNGTTGGTLSGNIVNAAAQYSLDGITVLRFNKFVSSLYVGQYAGTNSTGNANAFFGASAGLNNTGGDFNSFFGTGAGAFNTSGSNNSFFGTFSGSRNTTGLANSFFGSYSGEKTTTGGNNAYFGIHSGGENTTGDRNSFFSSNSGATNETGSDNAFFGTSTGFRNVDGSFNAFFGRNAGLNSRGNGNTFIGYNSAETNNQGSYNTIIGYNSNVSSSGIIYASAFGAEAVVSNSDTIVIGKQSGVYNSVIRPADRIIIPGTVQIDTLGTTGGTPLCRNGGNRISACSASLFDEERLENLSTRLRSQDEQIVQLQNQIADLKKLVCLQNPNAEVCK